MLGFQGLWVRGARRTPVCQTPISGPVVVRVFSREIVGAAVGETPVDEEPLLMLISGSMGSLNPKPKP